MVFTEVKIKLKEGQQVFSRTTVERMVVEYERLSVRNEVLEYKMYGKENSRSSNATERESGVK